MALYYLWPHITWLNLFLCFGHALLPLCKKNKKAILFVYLMCSRFNDIFINIRCLSLEFKVVK